MRTQLESFWSLPSQQMPMGGQRQKSQPHHGPPVRPQGRVSDRSDHPPPGGFRYLYFFLRQNRRPSVPEQRRAFRACRRHPRCRAAQKGDELAPLHVGPRRRHFATPTLALCDRITSEKPHGHGLPQELIKVDVAFGVIRAALSVSRSLPVCPEQRTSSEAVGRSQTCQQQTHAAQHHHSITSSARAKKVGGIVNLSALAVFRLMTSSTLVLCWIGRSVGLTPLRIFPT